MAQIENGESSTSVHAIVRRPRCRCDGYGFFWGSEIRGWRGQPHDRLICRECGKPFLFEQIWHWWKGYKSNEQVQTDFRSGSSGDCER